MQKISPHQQKLLRDLIKDQQEIIRNRDSEIKYLEKQLKTQHGVNRELISQQYRKNNKMQDKSTTILILVFLLFIAVSRLLYNYSIYNL